MANRVTESEVKEIFETDKTITAFITTANKIVTKNLEGEGLEDDTLKEIERWLSAHLASVYDKKNMATEQEIGDASVVYGTKKGLGLDNTMYGQNVKLLDSTGILANLGQKKATIEVIGTSD